MLCQNSLYQTRFFNQNSLQQTHFSMLNLCRDLIQFNRNLILKKTEPKWIFPECTFPKNDCATVKEHRTIIPILKSAHSFSKRDYEPKTTSQTAFPIKLSKTCFCDSPKHWNSDEGTENNSPNTILHITKNIKEWTKVASQRRFLQTRFWKKIQQTRFQPFKLDSKKILL